MYDPKESLILTLFLEEKSILISEGIVAALGNPRHLQLMINDEKHMLLLRSCQAKDPEAYVLPNAEYSQHEISGRSLISRIRRITGWTDFKPRILCGQLFTAEGKDIVLFSLDEAEPFDFNSDCQEKRAT